MEIIFYICAFLHVFSHVGSSTPKLKRQIIFPTEPELPPGTDCFTDTFGPGNCIRYTLCQRFVPEIIVNRETFCGYYYNEPRVCCPSNKSQSITHTTRRPQRRPSKRPVSRRPTRPTTRPTVPPKSAPNSKLQELLPKDCGKTTVGSTRIVGGSEAEVGAWPWMVALYINKRAECGASLVSKKYLVTAAHCVDDGGSTLPASMFAARIGVHNIAKADSRSTPQVIKIVEVIKNAKFNPNTYENDIALLRLEKEVQFRSQVQPICLPYDDLTSTPLTGRQAFIAGWGLTRQGGSSSPVLRQVQVPIWEQKRCVDAYTKDAKITDVSFCAGYAEGGKDSCQGDSGGPLMLPGKGGRFYLMGLVSYGKGCALPNFPGIYTNVRDFIPWLSEHMT